MEPLLIVDDLHTGFHTDGGYVQAVDGISYEIYPGETFAIVGESGSGKSVSALTIMGLINVPPGEITAGRIEWKGRDLLTLPEDERRAIRGKEIAMIFQDPMTSLNPVHTIGRQIGEMSRTHEGTSKKEARQKAVDLLDLVGIPQPDIRVDNYPHEFSGGMRQRAMIAMAIACKPSLLIADEPTTALDVTVQAQVLEVIHDIRDEIGSAVMLITHDLGVVAGMADRVMVMYAGRQAELGTADEVFYEPRHPYTLGLLASLPRVDEAGVERLVPIIGHPPSLINKPSGCVFHPRCPFVQDMCISEVPELRVVEGDAHMSACHYAETLRDVSRSDLAATVEELEELA
jgi:oligopeptide/dipeptide ABC transporter ATP-binding protein